MNQSESQNTPVIHRPDEQQFVGSRGGFLTYRIDGQDQFVILQTKVPEELRGQGIAAQLAEAALSFAEEQGYTILSQCSYIDVYRKRYRK